MTAAKTMAEVLSEHQKVSMGMTYGSPDTCRCGSEVYADRGDTEVTIRRDVAFAAHQAAMLTAAGFGLVVDAKAEAWAEGAQAEADEIFLTVEEQEAGEHAATVICPLANPYLEAPNDDQ